jgi:hypothetical protein
VRCCRMRSFIARAALDNAAPAGLMLAAALAGWLPSGVAQPPLQSCGTVVCVGASTAAPQEVGAGRIRAEAASVGGLVTSLAGC